MPFFQGGDTGCLFIIEQFHHIEQYGSKYRYGCPSGSSKQARIYSLPETIYASSQSSRDIQPPGSSLAIGKY